MLSFDRDVYLFMFGGRKRVRHGAHGVKKRAYSIVAHKGFSEVSGAKEVFM